MSVYKHPSRPDAWMIKISHGRKGKAEYIAYEGDYEGARQFERELRGEVNHTDPAFADHLAEFKVAYKNRASKRGFEVLENSLKHLSAFFGHHKMRHLTPALVEQYKAKRLAAGYKSGKKTKQVSKRTVNIELSALSAYITWTNENKGTSYPRPKRFSKRETRAALPQVLTPGEAAALISHLTGDLRTIVELMYYGGLRREEALTLTARDIDLAGGEIRVCGKGGTWRMVPVVLPETIARLQEAIRQRPEGWLFPSPRAEGKPRNDIRKAIRAAASAAGISKHIHPHLFRHSLGAAMIESGADIRVVQELFGHSELSTTQLYTQVVGATKRQALERVVALVAKRQTLQQQGSEA